MNTALTDCPRCGTPAEALRAGVCPRCALTRDRTAEEVEIEPGAVSGYRLLEKIGEGGMGEVFLAEQVKPVPREVALKRLKHSAGGAEWLRRFSYELEALALLDHRDVATVFDAGVAEDGRPFYTMELIEGLPLTMFCDRARLSVPERLRLMTRVCMAVDYAHRRGVWHGDLKPSNILATNTGGPEPELKLIDFGVRRASLAAEGGGRMAVMFTPGYASPGTMADGGWDSRGDVFSLGIVLGELISGRPPEAHGSLSKWLASSPRAAEIAAARGISQRALRKLLRDDVEWIAARAAAVDPSARYGSPADMAADLQRVLEGRPVQARPASARYAAGKFLRRERRRLLLGGGISLTVLIAGMAALLHKVTARRAERELQRVQTEARQAMRQAQALQDFTRRLVSLTRGPDAAARDAGLPHILEQTAEEAALLAMDDPDAAVSLLNASASAAAAYERADLAIGQWHRALAILESRGLAMDDPRRIAVTGALARTCLHAGDHAEAIRLLTPLAASAVLQTLPPENRLDILTDLARAHFAEREFQLAQEWVERAIASAAEHFGGEHPVTLHAVLLSGKALTELHRYKEARTALARAASGLRAAGDQAAGDEAAQWLAEVEKVLEDAEEED